MPERDRLRDLQVREAGHDRAGVLLGQIDQREAQSLQQIADAVDFAAQPQADVGRDLVVARAAGVQALAGIADQRRQARFDVQVHVFQIELPLELAALDFAPDLRHAALNRFQVVRADDLLRGQHRCVRERPFDVDEREPLVEEHRRRIAFDEFRHRLGEASRPGFAFFVQLGRHGDFRFRTVSGSRRREAGESAILASEFSQKRARAPARVRPGGARDGAHQAAGITLPV